MARAVLSRSVLLATLNSTYWLRKYWSIALPGGKTRQRHPKPGATCFRIASMTWAL